MTEREIELISEISAHVTMTVRDLKKRIAYLKLLNSVDVKKEGKMEYYNPAFNKAKACEYVSLDDTTIDKHIIADKFPQADLYIGRYPRWFYLHSINI